MKKKRKRITRKVSKKLSLFAKLKKKHPLLSWDFFTKAYSK